MKEEKIRMEPINRSFEVIRFALLEVEINRYKERIDTVVIDLNSMDMFLEYDWLVKHNLKVN